MQSDREKTKTSWNSKFDSNGDPVILIPASSFLAVLNVECIDIQRVYSCISE